MVRYFYKELDRTRATRKLINDYFVSSTKLDVLTFGDVNNHESLLKENVIELYYHESHLNRSSTAIDTKPLLLRAEAL